MQRYKLIATDLDGTVLDKSGRVGADTLAAAAELARRGVSLAIATGRTYTEIPEALRECPDFRYIIYSNGSVVLDKESGKTLSACIPRKTAIKMMEIFSDYEAHITARNGGACYYDGRYPICDPKVSEYFRIDPNHVLCVGAHGHPKENFFDFICGLSEVEVFSLYFHSDEQRRECAARLSALGELHIVSIYASNHEIFHREAGKDHALLRLADYLGISKEQTLTLGDSGNDIAMTKAAGLGLAVKDASPALLSVADGTVCEGGDGVMRFVLEKYFS